VRGRDNEARREQREEDDQDDDDDDDDTRAVWTRGAGTRYL